MDWGPPITSKTNARVKALRASFNGNAAEPGELLGIEGETLISEALRSGLALHTVFLREGSEDVLQRPLLRGMRAENIVIVAEEVFAGITDTASPQGIAAMVKIPALLSRDNQTVLIVEDLQDPGNFGTLVRSAEAFGAAQVLCTPATVNAWNPKTVRASAGSIFRIPVRRMLLSQIAAQASAGGWKLVAAVALGSQATSAPEAKLSGPCALMIGNEGAGLSGEAIALAHERVHIPCATESLNAAIAGSTLLYEAMCQNLRLHKESVR